MLAPHPRSCRFDLKCPSFQLLPQLSDKQQTENQLLRLYLELRLALPTKAGHQGH